MAGVYSSRSRWTMPSLRKLSPLLAARGRTGADLTSLRDLWALAAFFFREVLAAEAGEAAPAASRRASRLGRTRLWKSFIYISVELRPVRHEGPRTQRAPGPRAYPPCGGRIGIMSAFGGR